MVSKRVTFQRVNFPPETLADAADLLQSVLDETSAADGGRATDPAGRLVATWGRLSITAGQTKWDLSTIDEFFAEFRKPHRFAECEFSAPYRSQGPQLRLTVSVLPSETDVTVEAANKAIVERIMAPFERDAPKHQRPTPPEPPAPKPTVFIGHGRSPLWKDLKNQLTDHFGYKVEAYETGSRSGHTIRDILASMLAASTFAVVIMTAEDEQADGTVRARQNVVHEAGLFQGRLGFEKVAILVEQGVDTFSNIDGVQYIAFGKGNIREAVADVLAALRREFPGS